MKKIAETQARKWIQSDRGQFITKVLHEQPRTTGDRLVEVFLAGYIQALKNTQNLMKEIER